MDHPVTRSACKEGPRPCPFVSCRYHLAELARKPLTDTCALDVADRGEHSAGELSDLLGVPPSTIEMIESAAKAKVREAGPELDAEHGSARRAVNERVLDALRRNGRMHRGALTALLSDVSFHTVAHALTALRRIGKVRRALEGGWEALP